MSPLASVADPGCLSRIPDPDFYPSQIPDPKTATKERGEKNLLSHLSCSHKINIVENYFIFEMLKKKVWPNFQRIIELFTKNMSLGSGIRDRDPGSGSRKKPIPDPRFRSQKSTGSRIRIRNTASSYLLRPRWPGQPVPQQSRVPASSR